VFELAYPGGMVKLLVSPAGIVITISDKVNEPKF
jgi:hypothetical protein